jgi:pimeloyl-ACP methyl ester carboxylesterase
MSHRQDVFRGTTLHPHVIALHCSLSSGHQWGPLIEFLGRRNRIRTPDISGYGSALLSPITAMTLADEVTLLGSQLAEIGGPVHLIGHSYGAAIAFEMATRSSLASRVSTLTLIEPVLPTILLNYEEDLPLYTGFADFAALVQIAVQRGDMRSAVRLSAEFWRDAGARGDDLASQTIEHLSLVVKKIVSDFKAVFARQSVADDARKLDRPTLLLSGALSPQVTQRIVSRLAQCIKGARLEHLPHAGHMLPITHATEVNTSILNHLQRAAS